MLEGDQGEADSINDPETEFKEFSRFKRYNNILSRRRRRRRRRRGADSAAVYITTLHTTELLEEIR
jgi:hypothetical protein